MHTFSSFSSILFYDKIFFFRSPSLKYRILIFTERDYLKKRGNCFRDKGSMLKKNCNKYPLHANRNRCLDFSSVWICILNF